jgi:hypothetical protein
LPPAARKTRSNTSARNPRQNLGLNSRPSSGPTTSGRKASTSSPRTSI